MREEHNLDYLFVTLDPRAVGHFSDRLVIMYLARAVETTPTEVLFEIPDHSHARSPLAEVPRLDLRRKALLAAKGEIPSLLDPPSVCNFHPQCSYAATFADERCKNGPQRLREISARRYSARHLNDRN